MGSPRDDFPSPTAQINAILTCLFRYREGIRTSPVGLYCQAAMLAMMAILHFFGIMSREVGILCTRSDRTNRLINSHALIDVWNVDTGNWELHDPICDVCYGRRYGERSFPIDSFAFFCTPSADICHIPGEKIFPMAGSEPDLPRTLYNYYFPLFNGIVVNRYLSNSAFAMCNLAKVDMDKRFSGQGNMNVVEALNTWYQSPVIVAFDGRDCFTLPPITRGFEFSSCYPEFVHTQGKQ